MRAAIRQKLIDSIPEIGGRVYEPHAAGASTPKPYLVLRQGVDAEDTPWTGFRRILEVWPYVARTTFQKVDALADKVTAVLDKQILTDTATGEVFTCQYLGTVGQDFVDEEWDAITRGLRFRVFALGWLNGLTYDPDPVSVLRSWTAVTWPEVQTDPATWSPADATPGVYWRLVRLTPVAQTQAVNWVEAQITGHILAPSPAVRLSWVRKITEGIAKQRRLKMLDGGTLELLRVAADSEADPMRRGQVQLTARFGVLQPAAQAEILGRAVVGGAITGEVM